MSGTSLDGIDVCLAKIKGYGKSTEFIYIDGRTFSWKESTYNSLKELLNFENFPISKISELNFKIAYEYYDSLKEICKINKIDVKYLDFIAIHGQTVWHDPYNKDIPSTLQIGDGAVLSALSKTTVISNFRVKDLVYGGQGAPLVPFVDELLFSKLNKTVSLHNLGGISNLSLIKNNKMEIAFDTGPSNMMIDYYAKELFNLKYDDKGNIASKGKLIKDFYNEVMSLEYFKLSPPKSTGRELFGDHYSKYLLEKYKDFPKEDYLYTATKIVIDSIVNSYLHLIKKYGDIEEIIFSGGGAYNDYLLYEIGKKLPNIKTLKSDHYNVPIDFKEALAFLILGNQTINYQTGNLIKATGAREELILGQVSYYKKET